MSFKSSRALIARARQHAESMRGIDERFHADPVWNTLGFVEKDGDTGEFLLKRKVPQVPNDDLSLIVFEAAGALRAALDHAVFFASTQRGASPDSSSTKFPITKMRSFLEDEIKKNCRSVPQSIIDAIVRLEPYPTIGGDGRGNDILYAVAPLANVNKHRAFVPNVLSATNAAGIEIVPFSEGHSYLQPVSEWDQVKNEVTCFRASANREGAVTFQRVKFALAIDQVGLRSDVPAYRTITMMADEVSRAVDVIAEV